MLSPERAPGTVVFAFLVPLKPPVNRRMGDGGPRVNFARFQLRQTVGNELQDRFIGIRKWWTGHTVINIHHQDITGPGQLHIDRIESIHSLGLSNKEARAVPLSPIPIVRHVHLWATAVDNSRPSSRHVPAPRSLATVRSTRSNEETNSAWISLNAFSNCADPIGQV